MKSISTVVTGPARAGLFLSAVLLLTSCGITAPRSNEGFADLDSLGVFDTDRTFALSVGRLPIRIAIWALDEDDPETAEMLRGIEGVRVRIYEIDGDPSRVAENIHQMSEKLRAKDWTPVMLVREEDEESHMLVRMRDGEIKGITVLTSDGESEAVVVNVMGSLQPENFSEAMVAMDVDAPEVEVASFE